MKDEPIKPETVRLLRVKGATRFCTFCDGHEYENMNYLTTDAGDVAAIACDSCMKRLHELWATP